MYGVLKVLFAAAFLGLPSAGWAKCGGNFADFVKEMQSEARSKGYDAATVDRFFANVRVDSKVLKADRSQGVFQLDFTSFSRRLISTDRLNKARRNGQKYDHIFDRMEHEYGVSRGVLLAFWAFETDFGSYQGDFNTLNALMTLSHDCRRPALFRPQVFAALELYKHGDFSPTTTTGAWAGEIGMVQMLPQDIIDNGVDGDGDGHILLKTSAADALLSGAKMLQHFGWRAREPWLQEVTVPESLDWAKSGLRTQLKASDWADMGVRPRVGKLAANLPASLILPQGHKGPAFLAYPNFRVFFDWNQSFTYVLTAAYFANRIEGAPAFSAGSPERGLAGGDLKILQEKLARKGYNVGKIDGILGAGTRAAVQDMQQKFGLPADAWPTRALLNRL